MTVALRFAGAAGADSDNLRLVRRACIELPTIAATRRDNVRTIESCSSHDDTF